jgi:hypothetical protein
LGLLAARLARQGAAQKTSAMVFDLVELILVWLH